MKEVVECSRKLNVEAYDNDIIENIEEGCYVYFRNYRSVIIVVISCCSYDFHLANRLISSLINIFDRKLEHMGWKRLPKFICKTDKDKLKSMGEEIQ